MIFLGSHNKEYERGVRPRDVWAPHSGGQKSQLKVWPGLVPSEGVREDLSRPLLLLVASDIPWFANVLLYLHMVCPLGVSKCPLIIRTRVVLDQGPPHGLIVTQLSAKTLTNYLQIKSYSQVPGVRNSTSLEETQFNTSPKIPKQYSQAHRDTGVLGLT